MFMENEFDSLCLYIQKNHTEISTNHEMLKSIWYRAGQLGVFDNARREDSIMILNTLAKYEIYDFPFWLQRDVIMPLFERNATDEQRALYLESIKKGERICALAITEETGGSSFDNITSRAIDRCSSYSVSCRKNVVTNAMIADLFFLITRDNDGDLCAFIIDKSKHNFSLLPLNVVSEVKSLAIGVFECSDLELEKCEKLGVPGAIYISLTHNLSIERLCCAKLALDISRRLYVKAVTWLKARDSNNKYASIWFKLSEYYTRLHQCELMETEVLKDYLDKRNLFYSAARFKYSVIDLLLSMSSEIATISGCYSINLDSFLDTVKYINLAHAYAAAGGTQEVMLQIIDRYIHNYI